MVAACSFLVGQETLTVLGLFWTRCQLYRDLRTSLFCAQSLQTSPSRMDTKPEVKPSSLLLWHTCGLCGAMDSALDFYYARWDHSKIVGPSPTMVATFDILLSPLGQQTQRLAGHPDSVDKTTLLRCEVPGLWPHLWMLWSTNFPSRKVSEQVGALAQLVKVPVM